MDFSMDRPTPLSGPEELLQVVHFQASITPGEVPFDPELGLDFETLLFELSEVGLRALANTVINPLRSLDPRFAEAKLFFEVDPDQHAAWIWLEIPGFGRYSVEV